MADLWNALSVQTQDWVVFCALCAPALAMWYGLWRGFQPAPLVGAILWRFRTVTLGFALLIALSVALGVSILSQERALRVATAAAAAKFDMVVARPGSDVTMTLASVYLQPSEVTLVEGAHFVEIYNDPQVSFAAPLAFGDSVGASPIVGTTMEFIAHLADRPLEGRAWAHSLEAIVGADSGIAIGTQIVPSHGVGESADAQAHNEDHLSVVGILPRTGTPWDRAVMMPIEGVWDLHGLANGHDPKSDTQLGPPFDARFFPGASAVVVHMDELWQAYALRTRYSRDGELMAFFPGAVLSRLHGLMGNVRAVLSIMGAVTQGLVALSVLSGLILLSRLYARQMAILRAIGAPPRFVLAVVWGVGCAVLSAGVALGALLGWSLSGLASSLMSAQTGLAMRAALDWPEVHMSAAFWALGTLACVLPGLVSLRRGIVEGLRG